MTVTITLKDKAGDLWKKVMRPWTAICWLYPPIELLFIIWPMMVALVWRIIRYVFFNIPDPGYWYWGFKIKHLPYISWGSFPWIAWTIVFTIFLGLWLYVWYRLTQQPYSPSLKPGWHLLFWILIIFGFSLW